MSKKQAPQRKRDRRRHFADRFARRLVTLGGFVILVAIFAILVVILAEIVPLFHPAQAESLESLDLPLEAPPFLSDVDEYREVGFLLGEEGSIHLFSLKEGKALEVIAPPGLEGAAVADAAKGSDGSSVIATDMGRLFFFHVDFRVVFEDDVRSVTPDVSFADATEVRLQEGQRVRRIAYVNSESGPLVALDLGDGGGAIFRRKEKRSLIGGVSFEDETEPFLLPYGNKVTAMTLDERGEDLYVGTETGEILRYALSEDEAPTLAERVQSSSEGDAVTALGFLVADRTLVSATAGGQVASWQLVRNADETGFDLTRIHDFERHPAPVTVLDRCPRNKGFLSADEQGGVFVHFGTTGSTLLKEDLGSKGIAAATFARKGDGFIAADGGGRIHHYSVRNPHPDVSWKALFGKLWYEGYQAPEYVWQSTGATDSYEPKLCLVPVIIGTLKGTFYSMLIAIPIALLGALYTSQFMHPTLKSYIKPTVEIMAALPSVILGLIGGLWLAPVVEKTATGILIMPFVLGAAILLAVLIWRSLPSRIQHGVKNGYEGLLLLPVVLFGARLSLRRRNVIEGLFFGGDYHAWLLNTFGTTYDQRNSLVVGIAMGFAVIPIIFTIAEDSLSNVPRHLSAASLALGATPWTTAIRVVLPTASPGIFSAIMIGFGRAVGETMIVLMATGNTPIMDWSIFNGFRALSANIAVELPEAPYGGSLYRVLFVAALLLFIMTFFVNNLAEIVRLRLRKKYRYL